MHTGGIFKLPRPTHPMECVKHGMPLLRSSNGVREIWTCPACNTEVIDGWAQQPGVITVTISTRCS